VRHDFNDNLLINGWLIASCKVNLFTNGRYSYCPDIRTFLYRYMQMDVFSSRQLAKEIRGAGFGRLLRLGNISHVFVSYAKP